MTNAREQILRDVRANLPVDSPLPAIAGEWTTYADPTRQFLAVLATVGGHGVVVPGQTAAKSEIERLAAELQAVHIASLVPGIAAGNVDLDAVDDPHEFADVDLAVMPGEFAVAENAAIWLARTAGPTRVLYFLSQHVVLALPAHAIVNNMHEAYARLMHHVGDGSAPFSQPMFGTFMSGPSKTADIEQALVIGAHGARSLTVLLVQD